MAFEEETHQQDDEQLQERKENDQFQRELDEIIIQLENEQFQQELDEIIERFQHESQENEEALSSHELESEEELEQQDIFEKQSAYTSDEFFSQHEKNTEEQIIDDQVSQQSSSTEEELASHDSVREESDQQKDLTKIEDIESDQNVEFQQELDPIIEENLTHEYPSTEKEQSVTEKERELLNTLEISSQNSEDQLFLQFEEYKRELQAPNQELAETELFLQEEQNFVRNQDIDLNLPQSGETEIKNDERINQNVNKRIIRYDKEVQAKFIHNTNQEKHNEKNLKKQEIDVKKKRKNQFEEELIDEKQQKNERNGINSDAQQDVQFQKKIASTISHNQVQTLSSGSHTHAVKPLVKHLRFSNSSSDFLQEFRRVSKSTYQGDNTSINQLITKVNTQLHRGGDLNSGDYDILAKLGTNERYPNLAMVYRKDGQKFLELLDAELYDKLLEYQKQGNFRLEWQRFWFEGLGKIEPSSNFRKVFLVDLTGDRTLPQDMRRIWAVKNSYTWNTQTSTKRELHSKSIKDFFGTLFGKRPKYSDFREVRDYTYQKKMNHVWKKFQEVFSSEIILQTTKRPAIYPLKRERVREKIEHVLIGTFWHYYNSLDRIGKRNLKSWGYNNLLKFMEKKAEGVYRTIVDPNYVGQKFTVRVTNKGRAFSKFLESIRELKKTGKLESKYAINKIYREWIIENELRISKDLNRFSWTVDKARQSRTIMFKDIRDLMNENNTYGVGAVLEALFENEFFIKRLNKITGRKFSTKLTCSPSGSARINTDATSIAYPDLTITQLEGKPVNVQIKDLGKCYNQEKEEWVLIDQLKSLFGAADDYENITVHVINALDILDVVDPKTHPNLVTYDKSNFGLINIGIWENIEGIEKFGEIFSALRTSHEAGYSGRDAIERALNYLQTIHPMVDTDDVSLVETLEGMWSEKLAELIITITTHFGEYFRDKTVRDEKDREKQFEKIPQEQLPVTPIQKPSLLQTHKELHGTIKGGVLIGRIEKRLKHRPVFRRYWLECTGQIEATKDTSKKGPRGLIVDLTTDSFLPTRHRKVYMVKNNLRWNALGYRDKDLSLGSFNEFTKLLFNKIVIRRDFNNNKEFSLYIWKKIQNKWNLEEKPEFQLIHYTHRPQTFVLKEEYIKRRSPDQKKILQIHSYSGNKKLSTQGESNALLKSYEDVSFVKRFIIKLTNKIQSGVKLNKKDFKTLKKLNTDEKYPNIAFIRTKNGKNSIELLEAKLYDQLKKELVKSKNNLVFQRFWFECMGRIEVTDKDSIYTPRGLIVDLTKDSFLPKRHKQVYLVKNNKNWNELGHRKYKVSESIFDEFLRFFFNKKTIKNFNQNIQYPRYIWEQIQSKWRMVERDDFKLKPHGYRPNIYALKEEFTRDIVEKTIVGVYQEYISLLNRRQKETLGKSEFSNLVRFLNQTNDLPKVFRPSLMSKKRFDSLL